MSTQNGNGINAHAVKFAREVLKSTESPCQAIRKTATKFSSLSRKELTAVFEKIGFNQFTIRRQIQEARASDATQAKAPAAKKTAAKKTPGNIQEAVAANARKPAAKKVAKRKARK
jgi:hypothetical protein